MKPAGQVRVDVTLRHLLDSWLRMSGQPTPSCDVVFEKAVAGGTVTKLTNEADGQVVPTITRNGETNRVDRTFPRQTGAAQGVPEITKFTNLIHRKFGILVAGSAAMSKPASAERQAGRMNPASVLTLRGRHEKRASHLLQMRSLYSGKEAMARGQMWSYRATREWGARRTETCDLAMVGPRAKTRDSPSSRVPACNLK